MYDFNSQSLTVDATFTFITIVENKKYLTKIEEEAGLSNDDEQPDVPIDEVGD